VRIGIVGLGLIGGSLALALRRSSEFAKSRTAIIGIDFNRASLVAAKKAGAIDEAAHPDSAPYAACDLVLLCTPTPELLKALPAIAAAMHPGALLTDVCGVKELPCALGAAQRNVVFAGAHPMAGTEQRGFSAARANLFDGACVALCPPTGISQGNTAWESAAKATVRALWATAGATRFLELDPDEHDRAVAYASHLPALTAVTLFEALEGAGATAPNARALAAGGFRDTTRLAADGTVGQAAVHNRFIPEAARALGESLIALAGQIEAGTLSNDLTPLAQRLEKLADRRRAMPLPPVKA
jgi:prephenate dehydrogenase